MCLKWKLTILNIMKLLLAFLMKMRYKTWLQFCPPINLYQKTLWILDMLCVFLFFSRNYIWFGPYIFFHRLQNNPSCWQTNNTNDVRKVNKIWTCLSCNRSYEDQRTSENLIKCEPMPANFWHIAAIFFLGETLLVLEIYVIWIYWNVELNSYSSSS